MQMLAIRKPNMFSKSLKLPSEMADNELLIGPFTQLVSMRSLPEKGPLSDNQLHIIKDAGILINHGSIQECGSFLKMRKQATDVYELDGAVVALPGMIDPHTHICFAGSRAGDYALRLAGKDYLEIARAGGGIWQTVQSTRQAPPDELAGLTLRRADILLNRGCTTVEVKSGYGLSLLEELKILRAIKAAAQQTPIDVVSSCLAAHVVPHDFIESSKEYLKFVVQDLLPTVRSEKLASRVDIFVEHGAFGKEEALHFLHEAKAMGFGLTVHGDQFHVGGSAVAINARACRLIILKHPRTWKYRLWQKAMWWLQSYLAHLSGWAYHLHQRESCLMPETAWLSDQIGIPVQHQWVTFCCRQHFWALQRI
jgi:imidazolonepropionase